MKIDIKKLLKKSSLVNFLFKFYRTNVTKYNRVNYLNYPVIDGLAYPWFCKPCIDYLENIDFSGKRVLEFGAGFSTVYFDRKGARVISFERKNYWIEKLKPQLSAQCDLRLFKDQSKEGDVSYFNRILDEFKSQNLTFDLLIVDVFPRPLTCELFAELVNDDGFIIFDDSEWYPLFFKSLKARKDLLVVDFYGTPIGGPFQSCTSIIFKRSNIDYNQKSGRSMYGTDATSPEDRRLSNSF